MLLLLVQLNLRMFSYLRYLTEMRRGISPK